MASLQVGDRAPDFSCLDDQGNIVSLKDFKGKKLVIYFYPKDDTPGCTTESCDFRDNLTGLNRLGVSVVGVSKDSVKSHQKFKEKYDLTFPLLSDEDGKMVESYGVWTEKSMYGKKYMGIDRSTFLIDEDGKIAQLWRKVSVTGHVSDVIAATKV